jgi:hypothetical protein
MLFVGGALLYVDQAARAARRAVPGLPHDPAREHDGTAGREAAS